MELNEQMEESLASFRRHLYRMERSRNTIEKYTRDVRHFFAFLRREAESLAGLSEKDRILSYKSYLIEHYKTTSVNSMLVSLNQFFCFMDRRELEVKICRVQQNHFREAGRELTCDEYKRLVHTAEKRGKLRLSCILQTVASTGIRISELSSITVRALHERMAMIRNKGKERVIVLPKELIRLLTDYCKRMDITSGPVFVTRSGRPVDRKNIWAEMKKLCKAAGVTEAKVFPHNLRHLFARCYYEKEKDVVRLADYLGHSNVETTRRYTRISTIEACFRELDLGLLIRKEKTEPLIAKI